MSQIAGTLAVYLRRHFQAGHGSVRLAAAKQTRFSLPTACLRPHKPRSHAVTAGVSQRYAALRTYPVMPPYPRIPLAGSKSS